LQLKLLVYFRATLYILRPFLWPCGVNTFSVLVCCTIVNLATVLSVECFAKKVLAELKPACK
jgi:hypothetical protein